MNPPDTASSPYRPNPPPPAAPSRAGALARGAMRTALFTVGVEVFALVFALTAHDGVGRVAFPLFGLMFAVQVVSGLVAGVAAIVAIARRPRDTPAPRDLVRTAFGGFVVSLGMPLACFTAFIALWNAGGGAWGRPLRVRGRQLHPSLREGSDWTAGERPDPADLDEDTRRALEALWLHDAQKEHASVPAFARVSWLLASAGAPAELVAWSHRAALEEVDHTQRCFALAAGYGRRTYTVEPMPDLLLARFDARTDPRVTLAVESLTDGCQLEDFNADVAAACARACEAPVTRAVLEQIAREERSHAEFSWAVLAWLLARPVAPVRAAVVQALGELERYPRPTAVGSDKRALVARADPARLRAHGRLPDAEWASLWDARLVATRARTAALLGAPSRATEAGAGHGAASVEA